MELKRSLPHAVSSMILLLIVPYGIETLLEYYQEQGKRLLIVPYGIETKNNSNSNQSVDHF